VTRKPLLLKRWKKILKTSEQRETLGSYLSGCWSAKTGSRTRLVAIRGTGRARDRQGNSWSFPIRWTMALSLAWSVQVATPPGLLTLQLPWLDNGCRRWRWASGGKPFVVCPQNGAAAATPKSAPFASFEQTPFASNEVSIPAAWTQQLLFLRTSSRATQRMAHLVNSPSSNG
jgi:hypothetical protein